MSKGLNLEPTGMCQEAFKKEPPGITVVINKRKKIKNKTKVPPEVTNPR